MWLNLVIGVKHLTQALAHHGADIMLSGLGISKMSGQLSAPPRQANMDHIAPELGTAGLEYTECVVIVKLSRHLPTSSFILWLKQ
jgi:hypothetical protein